MIDNVCTVNPGHYEISKGMTKNDIEGLANNANVKTIQFSSPLANQEIDLLEKVIFSKRPDIELRIYGHYSEKCDLTFLERIPSLRKVSADCLRYASGIEAVIKLTNLEHLEIGIFDLDNFDFLEKISPNIKTLGLLQTRSKKPRIDCISRFMDLEYLYLEGQQNGIESISDLKNLQDVTLRSISTKNLDFLSHLKNLWSVDIKLGGIKNFNALTTLPNLKYLELWQIKGLSDLSFISRLPTLQNLFLQSLKQVTKIPSLNKNVSLRRVCLENLKGLTDSTALKYAPNLKEFCYFDAQNQKPENLIPVLENPAVECVCCGFGSDKKNAQFAELAKKYKKKKTWNNEFQYE